MAAVDPSQEQVAAEGSARGLLLVVSSPSGAGKTTLSQRLLGEHPELRFSVSYTTRARRGREQDGIDYHFVSESDFDRMVDEQAFAEWCIVHDRRYGTSVHTMRAALSQGQQVLLDIDYQGAEKIRRAFPQHARLVFVLPPSMAVLEARLRARATDEPGVIAARLRKAVDELRHYGLYDYLVFNHELTEAYAELEAIYLVETAQLSGVTPSAAVLARAEACRLAQRAGLAEQVLNSASAAGPPADPVLPSH